jgi:hypothetical protein
MERNHLEDLSVDGIMLLNVWESWTELIWLRTGKRGEVL